MAKTLKYFFALQLKLIFFSVFLNSFASKAQEEMKEIKLKSHRYFITEDTIIYAVKDTVVLYPRKDAYKIRRNSTPFLHRKYPGMVWREFYKPENETYVKEDTVLHIKSEDPYLAYEHKIIRSISIERIGVTGPKITNGFSKSQLKLNKIINELHTNTREWVVRQNLFFYIYDSLNSFRLADNERYLRTLPFIQDARILIDPFSSTEDSVDILVFTKDVWSFSGSASVSNSDLIKNKIYNKYKAEVYDANLFGTGQRLQFNIQQDVKRNPAIATSALYNQRNILHTFVDGTIGYSMINGSANLGGEQEGSFYIQLDRTLYRPTSKYSGGLQLSENYSMNVYDKTQLDFRKYVYLLADAWSAYSLNSLNKKLAKYESRKESMISARIFRQYFLEKPGQDNEKFSPTYNNRWFGIGSLTFFSENFYKTRYVLGFGKTEDIAYGYYISLNGGYDHRLNIERYYTGIEFEKKNVWRKGSFSSIQFLCGGFLYQKNWQDITINLNGNFYTRLYSLKRFKFRQQFSGIYTIGLNPYFYGNISIDGDNGIYGYSSSQTVGLQRFVFRTETTTWTPLVVKGFRLALFGSVEFAMIGSNREIILNNKLHSGIGTGLRIRNENLIFKTIQAKIYYYPNAPNDIQNYRLDLSTNIELKINGYHFHSPSFISFE